jgi:hypothetical protein
MIQALKPVILNKLTHQMSHVAVMSVTLGESDKVMTSRDAQEET